MSLFRARGQLEVCGDHIFGKEAVCTGRPEEGVSLVAIRVQLPLLSRFVRIGTRRGFERELVRVFLTGDLADKLGVALVEGKPSRPIPSRGKAGVGEDKKVLLKARDPFEDVLEIGLRVEPKVGNV